MFLKSITLNEKFSDVWKYEKCDLGKINLFVGKNASGKTRFLNSIFNIISLIRGDLKPLPGGSWRLSIDNEDKKYEYFLLLENRTIEEERLAINGQDFILRDKKQQKIYFEKYKNTEDMKVQDFELAILKKRDAKQYPRLEPIHEWCESFLRYNFNPVDLGQRNFSVFNEADGVVTASLLLKNTAAIARIYQTAFGVYSDLYKKIILDDLKKLKYKINEINIEVVGKTSFGEDLYNIVITEEDVGEVKQLQISNGMFTAISLLIQLNYAILSKRCSLVLIDDIGDGLDYERAITLVNMLIEKANENEDLQLIMTSNNHFIMNEVPLKYWHIVTREGKICKIFNREKFPEIFDEFEFTGLNNFDFFETKFYEGGFIEE